MNNQLNAKLADDISMNFETNEISTQADIEFSENLDQSTRKLESARSKRQNQLKLLGQHCLSTNSEAILLKIPEVNTVENNSNARLKIKRAPNYQFRQKRSQSNLSSNNS